MPRIARVVIPGCFYHITQRGNNRQFILKNDKDKRKYLYWVEEYRQKYKIRIFSYCVMENHAHFVAQTENTNGFARIFNSSHMRFAQYYNKQYKTSGHVWQGRFFSCLVSDEYLRTVVRYVERNPVRAGMVAKAWDWPWSSALEHIQNKPGIIKLSDLTQNIGSTDWKNYLGRADEENFLEEIRAQTISGRILGSREYLERFENKFGILLRKPTMGRPKATRK